MIEDIGRIDNAGAEVAQGWVVYAVSLRMNVSNRIFTNKLALKVTYSRVVNSRCLLNTSAPLLGSPSVGEGLIYVVRLVTLNRSDVYVLHMQRKYKNQLFYNETITSELYVYCTKYSKQVSMST